jgi:hypothetical protein
MSLFAISYALLWAIVVVLGYPVYLLVRHYAQQQSRMTQRYGAGPTIGLRAPSGMTAGLSAVDGQSHRDRPVVMVFATATCAECLAARDVMNRVAAKSPEIDFIAVLGRNDESMEDYIDGFGPSVTCIRDADLRIAQTWSVPGVPYMIALSASGYVQGKGKLDGVGSLGHLARQAILGTVRHNPANHSSSAVS